MLIFNARIGLDGGPAANRDSTETKLVATRQAIGK